MAYLVNSPEPIRLDLHSNLLIILLQCRLGQHICFSWFNSSDFHLPVSRLQLIIFNCHCDWVRLWVLPTILLTMFLLILILLFFMKIIKRSISLHGSISQSEWFYNTISKYENSHLNRFFLLSLKWVIAYVTIN